MTSSQRAVQPHRGVHPRRGAHTSDTRAPGAIAARGALLLLAGLGLAALGSFEHSLCPFANVTGYPCPGCGMTRAALALLTLDFGAAVRFQPLSPLLVPLILALLVPPTWRFLLGLPQPVVTHPRRWPTRLFVALSIAMLAVWAARFFGAFGGPVPVQPLWG